MDCVRRTRPKLKLVLEFIYQNLVRKIRRPDSTRSMSNASVGQPKQISVVDLDEKYSKVFRKSTSGSSFPSDRRLARRILEPGQEAVGEFLKFTEQPDIYNNLLSDYFNTSADSSNLCCIILENIEQARLSYNRSVQLIVGIVPISGKLTEDQHNFIIQEFMFFVKLENPFASSAAQLFQNIREQSEDLQSQLELNREKLDAATKETYILNKDLDTLTRLMMRLQDEDEHNKDMMRFVLQRKDDRLPVEEVLKILKRNASTFRQQLADFEEYVCLCFISINRARSIVIKNSKRTRHILELQTEKYTGE